MADILLTNGGSRSSYAALRNLAKHGIDAWCTDADAIGMCQWSRYRAGFTRTVSHYLDEAAYVAQIAAMCSERRISFLFPSHNETEILAKHRVALPEGVDALLPEYEHCRLFNNKARAYDHAKSLGVPVPRRVPYEHVSQISGNISAQGLSRVVVKLLTGNGAKGIHYADSPREAQDLVAGLIERYSLKSDRYPQIEERVAGYGAGCSVLYWNGSLIADFSHRRLREKTETGGTSTLRESLLHDSMRAATHCLFSSIGWHGLAMAEYKICEETDEFWFIEVNPRMWGSIPLAISAGVEFPYLAWLCATSGADAARSYDREVRKSHPWRGRWLLGDLILAASQISKLDMRHAASTLFNSKSDSLDDLYWDDPMAFMGELAGYGSRFLSSRSINPETEGMVK